MRVCARVLAAALMTGAIAGAFALPSLVGEGRETPTALPAPPSVKQRTLHLPVLQAPAHHTIVIRRHVAHHATHPALIAVRIAPPAKPHRTVLRVASAGRASVPTRHTTPHPTPAPAPAPPNPAPSAPPQRSLAATSQPTTTPPPAPPANSGADQDDGHGNGHAYGHYKQGDDDGGQGQDNGNGQGNGNSQGTPNGQGDNGPGNGKANGHSK